MDFRRHRLDCHIPVPQRIHHRHRAIDMTRLRVVHELGDTLAGHPSTRGRLSHPRTDLFLVRPQRLTETATPKLPQDPLTHGEALGHTGLELESLNQTNGRRFVHFLDTTETDELDRNRALVFDDPLVVRDNEVGHAPARAPNCNRIVS